MLVLLLVLVGCSGQKGNEKKYKIGVLQLADHPSLDATYDGMIEELDKLIGKDAYTVDLQNAMGEAANANMMAQKFVDDKVDLIYAIGTMAAQSAYNVSEGSNIPVVFNAVTDPVVAGLVDSLDKPGKHVTGVSDAAPIDKQIALIKEMLPNAKTVGILYNTGEVNSSVQIAIAEQEAAKNGLTIVKQGVSNTNEIQLAATTLAGKVDAIYNITDNMIVAATSQVVDVANSANIPVFAAEDGKFAEGLLATESISYKNLGTLGGQMIKEILVDGKKPADTAVKTVTETVLYLNNAVAEKLNISVPKSIADRAVEKK